MDVRKSFTDAGYIAVGLGVMGFQRAQVRRRQLQEHVQSAGSCVATRPASCRTGSVRTAATSTARPVRRAASPKAR